MQNVKLVDFDEANTIMKTRIKKTADTEKKALEKIGKIKEKEKAKSKKEIL